MNFSGSMLVSYFTVDVSFIACLMTYGLLYGFGLGIAYPIPMGCAMRVSRLDFRILFHCRIFFLPTRQYKVSLYKRTVQLSISFFQYRPVKDNKKELKCFSFYPKLGGKIFIECHICIYPTLPPRTECDTKSIFKRSKVSFYSEFSISQELSLPYYLPIASVWGEHIDSCIFQEH